MAGHPVGFKVSPPKKTFEIKIESPVRGYISADAVARVFSNLQDMFYLVGTEIANVKAAKRGMFPGPVRSVFELRVKDVKPGSVVAVFQVGEKTDQADLQGKIRNAERAFEKLGILFDYASEKQPDPAKAKKIFPDSVRRHRIFRSLQESVSPVGEFSYTATFDRKPHVVEARVVENVRRILLAEAPTGDHVFTGRITKIAVDRRRTFEMDTTEGSQSLTYQRDAEEQVREALGSLAQVRATTIAGHKYRIDLGDNIVQLSALPIETVPTKEGLLEANPAIPFEFQVDEHEHYVAYNEEFRILSAAKTIADLRQDIEDQFKTLWSDYVLADDSELTKDAIHLKRKLSKRLRK